MKDKEKKYVSVVVSVHHDMLNIITFFLKLNDTLAQSFEYYEIIIVNNGASVDLVNCLKRLKSQLATQATIIHLSRKHSLDAVMLTGLDFAIGDCVFEIDLPMKDFPFEVLFKLYQKMTQGYDVVSAVPKKGKPITSKLFYRCFKFFSHHSIQLNTVICRLLTRHAINALSMIKNKTNYRKIMLKHIGLSDAVLLYDYHAASRPSISFLDKIRMASDLLFLFSRFGLVLSLGLTFLFFLVSISLGIYALWVYFFFAKVVSGWTTLMLFLSAGFSGFFVISSIVIKYLNLIFKEQSTIPRCMISSVEKL